MTRPKRWKVVRSGEWLDVTDQDGNVRFEVPIDGDPETANPIIRDVVAMVECFNHAMAGQWEAANAATAVAMEKAEVTG